MYGSVTERVAKTGSIPMIIVPAEGGDAPNSIVVAYDFSVSSDRAAEFARQLHGAFHGSLNLVHAYLDVWAEYTDRGGAAPQASQVRMEALRSGLDQALDKAKSELFSVDAQVVQTHLRAGDAVDAVLEVANERHATLICAGATGKGGVEEFLLGSVACSLLRRSTVPVLLVPGKRD
ncbi:MAG: universal stress protein [Polyangiales bacterium]